MSNDNIDQMIEEMVDEQPKQESCSGWCLPLYIYIFLAILQFITIMMMKIYHPGKQRYVNAPGSVKARYAIISIIWNTLVGVVMYYLCKYCHSGWSWFILLLPIILNTLIFLLMVIVIMYTIMKDPSCSKSRVDY
ncbi:hypothetical protein LCGC14_2164610 [marine sediment metagenome]|uniref:Uncharacterized protein n=1 Tax=marine sediment metagenome TaxID=412755 RepID=A0A0F9EE05_9ZZZZ